MGQDLACTVRHGDRTLEGKAYLETDHVLFRGAERFKVLFKDMKSVQAEGGVLRLEFDGGPLELELGAAAEKWAHKILNPPPRVHKLGVKPGMAVRVVGDFDPGFLADLENSRVETAADRADLIFLEAGGKWRLAQIHKLAPLLKPDGALWVVYPKGDARIRETDVIAAGRKADLKDVKVASFSLTHTALKFVIPVTMRPGRH